jgi:Transcription factor WhiB
MRIRTGEAEPEGMPRAYTCGHGVPIGWKAEARCGRQRAGMTALSLRKGGEPSFWCVEPFETYRVGNDRVSGAQLLEIALGECSLCPVQWDCASAAVQADEPWGVWGMSFEALEWVKHLPSPETFIRSAERRHKPIQFAVARAQRSEPVKIPA